MDQVPPSTDLMSNSFSLPEEPAAQKESQPKKLATLPLYIAATGAHQLSTMAKNRLFVPASALGWATFSIINSVFKGTTWLTGVAKDGEMAALTANSAYEISRDMIDASQKIRENRQGHIGTGAAILSTVPYVGPIAQAVNQITAAEAKAEAAVSWWGKTYLKGVFDFLRVTSPYILQSLHFLSKNAERATDSLKVKFYTGMCDPDLLSDNLQAIGDRASAIRYKLLNAHMMQAGVFQEKKTTNPTNLSYEEFTALSREEQEDILFLVENSQSMPLHEATLREVVERYNRLPLSEKQKLTPADFRAMSEAERLMALQSMLETPASQTKEAEIDMQKLLQEVGPQVMSRGRFYNASMALGQVVSAPLEVTGHSLGAGFEMIGQSNVGNWIERFTNLSATSLEILMLLPYGKKFIASLLQKCGVPVYAIERRLAQLPGWIVNYSTRVEGKVVESIKFADASMTFAEKAKEIVAPIEKPEYPPTVIEHFDNLHSRGTMSTQSEKPLEPVELTPLPLEPEFPKPLVALAAPLVLNFGKVTDDLRPTSATAQVAAPAAKLPIALSDAFVEIAEEAKKDAVAKASAFGSWLMEGAKSSLERRTHSQLEEATRKWTETAGKLAQAKVELEATQISQAAILEMGGLWGNLLSRKNKDASFSNFLQQTYVSYVSPVIQSTIANLETVHKVNVASANMLSAQMTANLQTELQLQQFLEEKAQSARLAMNKTEKGSITHTILNGVNWGLPMLSWLFLSSQSLVVLPFIVQRIVPHALRAGGAKIAENSKPFWFFLAHGANSLASRGSQSIQKQAQSIGIWMQQTYAKAIANTLGWHYIDPKRIEHFKKLTESEQKHLYEITQSKSSDSIEKVLTSLDALAPDELLALSPSSYSALPANMQARIQFIVKKHGGKPLNAEETVERFNALPEAKRKELAVMTVSEYFQLPLEEQEDILFTVAHARSNKLLQETDVPTIVQTFNTLPEEAREGLRCRSAQEYRRMTHSDQGQVRMLNAIHAKAAKDKGLTWELEQFFSLDHTTNLRLRNVLQLYSLVSDEERSILTPSKVRNMSKAKLAHLLSIIERYHPECIQQCKSRLKLDVAKIITTNHPLEKEKLSQAIASLFNKLPVGERAELLLYTKEELAELNDDERSQLVLFVSQEKPLTDSAKLKDAYNNLDRMKQAEWREQKAVSQTIKERVHDVVDRDCVQLEQKLAAVQKRIAKLSDGEFLALNSERGKLQSEQRELVAKKKVLDSLTEAHAPQEQIERLAHEIRHDEVELATHAKEVKANEANFKLTQSKLTHLLELEHQYKNEIQALQKIVGDKPVDDNSSIVSESPQVTQAINTLLNTTINEVGQVTLKALLMVISKKRLDQQEYNAACQHAREFLDEAIAIRQEQVTVVEDKIASLRQEIDSLQNKKAYHEIATKQLELRALVHFNLHLARAVLSKFEALRTQLEERLSVKSAIIGKAAPAA